MNKFFDRKREIASLTSSFESDEAGLYILYGRRRLGKTTILRNFARDKPGVYHMADRSGLKDAIRLLAQSMGRSFGDETFATPEYRTFGDLFEAFDRLRPDEKTYLILDEYQYLCEVEPALSSIVQRHWDTVWKDAPLMVVLCGSVMSMMYKETLARSSPLYGRRTGQWLLRPLRFADSLDFFARRAPLQKIRMWALSGGVPRYAELVASEPNFSAALRRNVLSVDGALYAEARFLLQDEVTTPNVYWSILRAVAGGANRISEIAGRVGHPANQLTRYLAALIDMGLVARHVPVTERNPSKSKRGLYQLEDPFLRLWFGCVAPFESLLEFGRIDQAEQQMRERLKHHLAWAFEGICREHVEDRLGQLGGVKVGRYWDKTGEVDVVSVDAEGEVIFAGECKWGSRPASLEVGKTLLEKVRRLWPGRADRVQLAVFAAKSFTGALERWAEENNCWLVDASALCGAP